MLFLPDQRTLYANPALMDIFGCESMGELMEPVGRSFRGIVRPLCRGGAEGPGTGENLRSSKPAALPGWIIGNLQH